MVVKGISIISGFGLVALWIAGLASPGAAVWLTWLDGIAALFAFAIAGTPTIRTARPIAMAIGLYVVWIIALSKSVVPWQSWWTFAFASVFLVLGIASETMRQVPGRISAEEEFPSVDRFRKSA